MKIKINDKETYEINVETEILNAEDFLCLMDRLRHIEKMVDKMSGGMNVATQPVRHGRQPAGPWTKDRNEAIKAIKTMYFGTSAEKEAYGLKHDRKWSVLKHTIKNLKKNAYLNLQPEEVGVKRWPSIHKGDRAKDLRIIEHTTEEQDENKIEVQESLNHFE